MPKINFSDTSVAAIAAAKTTWFSDSSKRRVMGLRLMAGPTLQDLINQYIARRRAAGNLSARPERDYRIVFDCHAADWLKMPLADLTTYQVEDWFKAMRETPGAANKLITVLRGVIKYATRHDEVKRDPTSAVTDLYTLKPKTEALQGDFLWIDDELLHAERDWLVRNGAEHRFIRINADLEANALLRLRW